MGKETEHEYIPKSAMSIQAHPDDQEFSLAGTLAKWARAGCEITSVILTSGDAGSNAEDKDAAYKPELARIREAEQLAANKVLGVKNTVFLHFPDGELQHTLEVRKAIAREIRRYKPEVALCGDPTVRFLGNDYMNHPDHRAAADAACDAIFPSAGTRLIFADLLAEGFNPHDVKRVYLWGSDKSDVWVDTTDTIGLKIEALRMHASQLGDWDPSDEMRKWGAAAGKDHGMACAESFKVMIIDDR
jgi:LmbE family N-acetylglucosaminyl deacetylase